MIVDLVLRWMHILAAMVLVGGTIFLRCAYYSASADQTSGDRDAEVRRRWSKLVAGAVALLLISGLANIVRILTRFDIAGDSFPESAYHAAFGIKFLLAFGVFFLSSALAGKSGLAEKLRQQEGKWLTVNAVLAVTVVLLAGVMKISDRVPKSPEPNLVPDAAAALD